MWRDFVIREDAADVALIRPLEVVERREVVEVGASEGARPKARDGRRLDRYDRAELGCGRVGGEDQRVAGWAGRGRTAAARRRIGTRRNVATRRVLNDAGRIVTITLKHGLHIAIAEVGNCMAPAIVEARTNGDRAVEGATVGRASGRQRELSLAGDCLARLDEVSDVEAIGDVRIILVVLPDAVVAVEPDPFKLVSMMKLTTPATASAPYTDDAPPVRTSARRTSAAGMTLRSADWFVLFGSPGIRRRPLTRTSERFAPR